MPGSPLLAVCSRKWQVPETMQIWGKEALTEGPGGGKFGPQGTSQMALVVKSPPAIAGDVRDRAPSGVGNIPWRRKWQPTAGFLPGESRGQRRLAGYSPWGCKDLDMTEAT